MLSLEPKDLMREISRAREWIKPVQAKMAEVTRRLVGEHYRAKVGTAGGKEPRTPENYPFAYKMFVKPQLLYGVPSVTITAKARVEDQPVADARELMLNTWAKQSHVEETLDHLGDDCFVGFGVSKVGVEVRGDYDSGGLPGVAGDFDQAPNFPFMVRVDPRFFFVDPEATELPKSRFIGQLFERDLEDVQNDERYDATVRQALTQQTVEADPNTQVFPRDEQHDAVNRKRINLFELYLPEHGLIITLAQQGTDGATVLRQERYFGPKEGPYTLWGLSLAPSQLIPLSPLVALWDEFLELQTHASDLADSATTHKSLLVGRTGNTTDANTVKNAKNGDFVLLDDPTSVEAVSLGGASDAQTNFTQFLRERLDRNLGFTDAQRGEADPNTTATGAQIASSSSDLRISEMQKQLKRAVESAFRKVDWYFENDASIGRIEMVRTDPVTGQKQAGVFIAGKWPGGFVQNTWVDPQPQSSMNDFTLQVDVRTMSKQDDAIDQRRAQDRVALLTTLAPIIPQTPWVNWKVVLDDWGKAHNDPFFADRVLISQSAPPMQQPMQPGMMPPPGQPQPQQPMMAGPATPQGIMANARGGVTASRTR